MDIIKGLIGFFFKIAFAALLISIVWWLVSLLFPALSFSQVKNLVIGDEKRDLLPSPRKYSGLIKSTSAPTATSNTYVHGAAFDGYGNSLVSNDGFNFNPAQFTVYTDATGKTYISSSPQPGTTGSVQQEAPAPSRSMYIRNLSIYEGVGLYTGAYFIGEAKNEMFYNGSFPVLIVDTNGRVVAASPATVTDTWSVPGWTRFGVRITGQLPSNAQCALVFEQGRPQGSPMQPVRVGMPVRCN